MGKIDHAGMYKKIFEVLGELTPLKADCGLLCDGACCKGDENTGMRLFPHEESPLKIINTPTGERLAVCDGTCDRSRRPLSCRIFPFFPTIDEKGRIFVEADPRARTVCPLILHSDELVFDPKFFRAVEKVGKLLAKDPDCRDFLYRTTEEIDTYLDFLSEG